MCINRRLLEIILDLVKDSVIKSRGNIVHFMLDHRWSDYEDGNSNIAFILKEEFLGTFLSYLPQDFN
ncbi:hypothetical protein C0J52_07091 [Blattella germanica]|nr:hypothetical protein C0J52_07091 [Blattella germanica]